MKTNDYKQERAIQLLFGEKFIAHERIAREQEAF
jgi:hypothetical protein